jgi:hypothetical protein
MPEVGFDDAQKINALIENNQFAAATRIEVKEQERLYDSGDQSWRFRPLKDAASHLLHVQAEAWNITLGPELEFDSCEVSPGKPSEVGLIGSCGWFKRDGLASFYVSLRKFNGSDISPDDRKLPWVAMEVSARTCEMR